MADRKFQLIHCNECGVTSPREATELARASGRMCLVCGALLGVHPEGADVVPDVLMH